VNFTPIETDRLLIRAFTEADIPGFWQRRNDPEVARYQDWALPFSMEEATSQIKQAIELGGPTNEQWWQAIVCDRKTGEVFGDLAVHLIWEGRSAEVGYTFATAHWGKGYAVEALEALVEYLFEELKVTRIFGQLHPDNPASAMVLERAGFLFEGHTKLSFWVGDENSDDWIYGLTRSDWETWRDRPRHRPSKVALVEINQDNLPHVKKLRTHKSQERFVATVAQSFNDALFPEVVDGYPAIPWMRAVAADDDIVGFVMLALSHEHFPEPFLWRLLIDRLHQRRGIGERVLGLVAEECRQRGDRALATSWGEGKGSPSSFYLKHGFAPTGQMLESEVEGRKLLS
jgi:RimJ/RimL family protein N-acetyltransferase